jgi:hypothetical protein
MNETQRDPRHNHTGRRTPSTRTRPGRAKISQTRQQLSLLEQAYPWRLDARTRSIGRDGLVKARAALAAAPPRNWDSDNGHRGTPHAA